MLGIGAFTPLEGFMGKADWQRVCDEFRLADGTFWPIPITLSMRREAASRSRRARTSRSWTRRAGADGQSSRCGRSTRSTTLTSAGRCFAPRIPTHPGVAKVMAQGEVNLAGPVTVLSEGGYPARYSGPLPAAGRNAPAFSGEGLEHGGGALQLRNPMHRSHESLAKIAVEVCDGVLIQQILGKLKPGDIPAEVRVKAVDMLVERYFVKDTCIQAGVPLEMRYAGPREALLHAVFRQNFGCSHLIVGRDHAGVGDYYGPFDAQKIFDEIPADALEIQTAQDRLDVLLRQVRRNGLAQDVPARRQGPRASSAAPCCERCCPKAASMPDHFSRPEVLEILKEYYATLEDKVPVTLHKFATGGGYARATPCAR